MIQVAPGVRLPREIALAVMVRVVEDAFEDHGSEATITSGREGTHSVGSEHYVGHALDWRTKHLPLAMAQTITATIKRALGPDFDVILEDNPPHLHIEYDPK